MRKRIINKAFKKVVASTKIIRRGKVIRVNPMIGSQAIPQ